MRALTFTNQAPDSTGTAIVDVPDPTPGAGEIVIGVEFAGINFIDVMARRGDAGYATSWPHRPGKEVAGRVRAVGTGVTEFKVGDRVAAFAAGGGFADLATTRAELTAHVPDSVPLDQAAAAPLMLSTAYLLLTQAARFGEGERILVQSAAGGVGSVLPAMARALGGAHLVGVVGSAAKVTAARTAGYDEVYVRDDGLADAVLADGGQVDVVLDPLGTTMLEVNQKITRPGGRIVLFGNATGAAPGALPPLSALMGGNISIVGFSVSALTGTAPDLASGALASVLDLIAQGRLVTQPTVVAGLPEVPAVHDAMAARKAEGKYVVALT